MNGARRGESSDHCMDERYFLRILLGTSLGPKSPEELSRIYHIPRGVCADILHYLEKRGFVSNAVTLFTPDGRAVKYYVRTEMRLRVLNEAEALAPPA
ncbi:MAG: hypothetical protein AABY30_02310 [Candidatus Thermoplasmatota archaeon]